MSDGRRKLSKAYMDAEFMMSPDARTLRILSEYLEPMRRFRQERVKDTIVFYGSARTMQPELAKDELTRARSLLEESPDSPILLKQLARAETDARMSRYYAEARELAWMLTKWSQSIRGQWNRFLICSGGGPGIMEAANRGAAEAGGKTVGLTISLPFEEQCNPHISDNLAFEFHYFFMRKYWFVYMARALVIFPGGFGTLDELMDLLTLLQTRKIRRKLPVIIYGSEYWNEIINFEALARWGTISPEDLDLLTFCDTPREAFDSLVNSLVGRNGKVSPRK